MKQKKLLMAIAAGMILLIASITFASPHASIIYQETEIGNGLWRYDYTFTNASDANEYLYSVWLDFDRSATITGLPLPTGWDGTMWAGVNTTAYLDTSSTGFSYDIPAGNSKSGFGFTINYKAGNIPFTAYFDDHAGNISPLTGATALAPEPVSSLLFLSGGITLAVKYYRRKRTI